jgi:thymidylate kinase
VLKSLLDYFRKILHVDQFSFENVEESEQIKKLANQRDGIEKVLLLQALHVGQDNAISSLLERCSPEMLILDKSFYHMLAYNMTEGVPDQSMDWIENGIVNRPDFVLYLEVPLSVSLVRKPESKIHTNISKAVKIKTAYDLLAKERGWGIIDATQSEEGVLKNCIEAIEKFFNN